MKIEDLQFSVHQIKDEPICIEQIIPKLYIMVL